jgi:hypothetical protein
MHTNSVPGINMDFEKVEGLCFPLLFPHGELDFTYSSKSCLSQDEYVMANVKAWKNTWWIHDSSSKLCSISMHRYLYRRTICIFQRSVSGQSKSSVRCLDLLSSGSKLFHVDGTTGPILAYGFLFASPWSMSIIQKIKHGFLRDRPGKHLITSPNMWNRIGMPLDILMSLWMNRTSQAVSMVHHATWLPWQKMFWFWFLCQETSTRDTANKRSLELCASIVHVFLDSCSKWYFSVVFLTGQVFGNWYL